jgi:hypothetical protein
MAAPDFSLPFAERAGNSLSDEWRQLEIVNCMFRLLALGSHGRSQTITILKQFVDIVEILLS